MSVVTAGAALSSDQGGALRCLAIILATLGVVIALAPSGRGSRSTGGGVALASAYSRESSGPRNGCDGSQLHDPDLTFASFVVPCGARVRFCVGRRCVVAIRRDSGPFVAGRLFDLNVGIVRALGFASATAFGVRSVSWERVR